MELLLFPRETFRLDRGVYNSSVSLAEELLGANISSADCTVDLVGERNDLPGDEQACLRCLLFSINGLLSAVSFKSYS